MTFQVRDTLRYRGQDRQIRALPLQSLGARLPPLPAVGSACWRGYQASWEMRDDALHVVAIRSPFSPESDPSGLDFVFSDNHGSVEAEWFSGEVPADDVIGGPDGEFVRYRLWSEREMQFLWFVLVVLRGKVLLEDAIDLEKDTVECRLTRHA